MAAVAGVRGVAASPGRASGPIFIAECGSGPAHAAAATLDEAVRRVAAALEGEAAEVRGRNPDGAAILEAQALMARDPSLRSAIESGARSAALGPAITAAAAQYADTLAALPDPYLRERADDVREVGRLLAAEVAGRAAGRLAGLRSPAVVVAAELSPADTLSVPPELLIAIVTEVGGANSHAAIVARELGVPAVVGAPGAVAAARGHRGAAVDGGAGTVDFVEEAGVVRAAAGAARAATLAIAGVELMANVGSPAAVAAAVAAGAAGIGLYRTEFLFMGERGPMAAADQAAVYRDACAAMAPHPVIIRTLDAGADKPLAYLPKAGEPNPQLGRRGVRLWLASDALWRPQVEALVATAAEHPNLRVMVPMVAAREELVHARRLVAAAARRRGCPPPPVGMMVEVPAAAAALEAFAGACDFVSLGTNDLTQYTVAADRELKWDAGLSEWNPGVLRLIATAIGTANRLGIHSGVCGELAGRPEGAAFLAGVGVRSLSMTASSIPAVEAALTRLGADGCRAAAAAALRERTAARASARLREALAEA